MPESPAQAATKRSLSPAVRRLLVCPHTGEALREVDGGLVCESTGDRYPVLEGGQVDLRLQRSKRRTVTHELGTGLPDVGGLGLTPLKSCPKPEVDFAGVTAPRHLSQTMLSYFPKAQPGRCALDLGCGRAIHRGVIERCGYEYVGVDYHEPAAPILADAHALPFADESFDFVLSVAVLEHIRYPFVMIEEAARVMTHGARLIGTVAFLEPHHDNSFFHHTHLGVVDVLRHAGLDVRAVAPHPGWSVLQAQARTLFPLVPRRVSRAIVWPLHALHRLWWLPIGWVNPEHERRRRLRTSGAFTFIAVKP